MSAIRIPFDDINAVSISGLWSTTLTTGAAPLPPAAPGVYSGTLDFTGVAPGIYPYTYDTSVTVGPCTSTSTETITYDLTQHLPVSNDDCAIATNMAFPYGGGCFPLEGETILEECPGIDQADFDGSITAPTEWGTATFNADVWYKFTYDITQNPGGIAPINMIITVDGTPYDPAYAINYPAVAIYSSCSTAALQIAQISPNNVNSIVLSNIFGASFTYYIRVSAPEGFEGKFDISLNT